MITAKGMEPAQSNRLPPLPAERLSEAQRQAVAEFRAARGADLTGPFHPLLRSPELMTRTRAMGDYLRYKTTLPPRLSELVILMTARAWTQQYEWNAHYPIAIKAGDGDPDEISLVAIDAGATDVAADSGIVEVYTEPHDLHRVQEELSGAGYEIENAELSMRPKTLMNPETDDAIKAIRLLEKLEDLDDVQTVYSNLDITDEVMAAVS